MKLMMAVLLAGLGYALIHFLTPLSFPCLSQFHFEMTTSKIKVTKVLWTKVHESRKLKLQILNLLLIAQARAKSLSLT
jgi:hypothetical protein